MPNCLNLDYLNTFLTAAETGRLNITAELVYRSHSAVSMQIKKLEEQVGAALFIRNKDTLTLTRQGEILMEYAKHILELNSAVFSSISNHNWSGNIVFGIPTDYSELYIRHIHPRISEHLSDIRLTTVCSRSRELRRQMKEGKINIAIVAMEPQYTEDMLLWEEPLCWVHAGNFERPPDAPLPIALFADNCIVNNHSLYCLKKSNVDFNIVFTSTMLDNIVQAVKAGVAVSLLPKSLITDDLQCVSPEFLPCPFSLKIGCCWDEHADYGILNRIMNCIKEWIAEGRKG